VREVLRNLSQTVGKAKLGGGGTGGCVHIVAQMMAPATLVSSGDSVVPAALAEGWLLEEERVRTLLLARSHLVPASSSLSHARAHVRVVQGFGSSLRCLLAYAVCSCHIG
jgi:hypothetical protein